MAIKKISANLLGNNAVQTANIAGGAISAADIANNSITAAKLSASTSPTFGGLTVDSTTLVVDATNNRVGIGITSPSALLSLNKTYDNTALAISDDSSAGDYVTFQIKGGQYNGGVNKIEAINTTSLAFATGSGTEAMRINTSGNVGIGTTSPGVELDIKRRTNAYPLRVSSEGGQGRAMVFADVASSPSKYNWIAGTQYNVDNAYEITPSTAVGGYTFSNPAITVLSSGNVGIGSTNPSANLQISDSSGAAILKIDTSAVADAGIQILGYDAYVGLGDATNGLQWYVWNDGVSSSSSLKFGSEALSGSNWYADASQAMVITASGNVGIGTTNPTEKLQIAGGDFGFNLGTGNLGNYYFILNAGTNNDGGFVLKRDNNNQYQIVNNASGNLTIYQYVNSKEIFNIDTAGTANFYGDAIKLPTGGASDRPSTAVAGMMRYNTDLDVVEIYDSVSTEWRALQVGDYAEAPRFINPTTYHTDHFKIIGPTGQIADADFNSGYGTVTLNCSFVGNFTVLSKWSHDYMGIGIAYRNNLYNSTFTGESSDGNGPYGGGSSTDGFDSTVSYMGQYHWPVQNGGSDDHNTTWYIKHQRSSNTISTHYSTNSAAEFDKNHSSWTQVQSATVASSNECKPVWGEAAGTENVKLQLNYVEGEYHTKNYAGNQEIVN